ncbi:PQQ-dependent sugar dehydrogenase [Poseidonibacter lekithochrous]|uniref:PQQ-dependent sugar dehydrogenase n=1 Tax=Poseidonibacter TaxID=2321187 RepID=UPI001C07FD39|nr:MULTISPECIES: PQQ-dependent sugar dehydrogenase [Poseidonibacter]MBU3013698.1 PQQ-dependent sugar dehydrogenase [Poseidonibacter lekithochrous]MDO6826995.1 PQQ-dependent sugar dehydrogenase [Poseidonibacter sp. 1_MG-2023]
MRVVFLFIITSIFSIFVTASTTVTKISSNQGIVWGMVFIDENNLLLSHKDGRISLLNLQSKEIKNIENVPKILNRGQGGLLDIQKKDEWIYLTYVKSVKGEGATTLARAKLENNKLIDFKDLLVTKSISSASHHFGSRITFDDTGHLYFSIGDRGTRDNAQNLKTHAGSIIRLNLDGSVPRDNPFLNDTNALPEIYSYGHRNPQGLFYDINSKKLYSNEHGPRGGDEINIIEKGANYGWPIVSQGKEYWNPMYVGEYRSKKEYIDGIKVYIPSIAPSSLLSYSGKKYKNLKGNLFSGALKLQHLNQIILDKNDNVIKENRLLEDLHERIRNVIESPNGEIYISTDSGNIYLVDFKE